MYGHDVAFQKQLKFLFDAKGKSNRIKGNNHMLCSTTSDNLNNNDIVFLVKTTNFKEISRYALNNVLGINHYCYALRIIWMVPYLKNLSDGTTLQRVSVIAEDDCKSSWDQYFNLKVPSTMPPSTRP